MANRIFLVRHGETAWSLSGQHTGHTNIPLTRNGENQAKALGELLKGRQFTQAFVSPLERTKSTFSLIHLDTPFVLDKDLYEWDYGQFEGLTTEEIHKTNPSWTIFTSGAPGGESPEMITQRAKKVLNKIEKFSDNVLICSSGHFLRALAATWLRMPIELGAHLKLCPASLSILGYEHNTPAIELWNHTSF